MGIYTILLLVLTGLVSYTAFSNREAQQKLLFHPYSIKREGDFFRFLSHGFVHGSMGHLLINMFVLYQFGSFTESLFENAIFQSSLGKPVFLFFYLSAIIVASIPSYFKHQDNPAYMAVGASGATSALIVPYVMFDPWAWFIFPPVPAIAFAVLYIGYSHYMDKKGTDNVGHNAHLWGFIYGIVFMIVLSLTVNPDLLEHFKIMLMKGPRAFGT